MESQTFSLVWLCDCYDVPVLAVFQEYAAVILKLVARVLPGSIPGIHQTSLPVANMCKLNVQHFSLFFQNYNMGAASVLVRWWLLNGICGAYKVAARLWCSRWFLGFPGMVLMLTASWAYAMCLVWKILNSIRLETHVHQPLFIWNMFVQSYFWYNVSFRIHFCTLIWSFKTNSNENIIYSHSINSINNAYSMYICGEKLPTDLKNAAHFYLEFYFN